MNFDQALGVVALVFGLVNVGIYAARAAGFQLAWAFRKLEPMRRRWGHGPGTAVHVAGYVVAPLVIGLVLLLRG